MYLDEVKQAEDRTTALGVILANYGEIYKDSYPASLLSGLHESLYLPTVLTEHVLDSIEESLRDNQGMIDYSKSMSLNRLYAYLQSTLADKLPLLLNLARDTYLNVTLTTSNNLVIPSIGKGSDGEDAKKILLPPKNGAPGTFDSITKANEMKVILIYLALWNGTIPVAE